MRGWHFLVALALAFPLACGDRADDLRTTRVVGDLTETQLAEVEWAVARFAEVDLQLPPEIEVQFTNDRNVCGHAVGRCNPDRAVPLVVVCQHEGDTEHLRIQRRITLLHELTHVWHRSLIDGAWSDLRAFILAEDCPEEEMVETVANVISWGLLDTLRRPVGGELRCDELYDRFVRLTGHAPLGPLPANCRPIARVDAAG